MTCQELQRLALLGRIHRRVVRPRARAGQIAHMQHPAHVLGGLVGRAAHLAEAAEQHAARARRIVRRLRLAGLQALPQFLCELQAPLVVGQRVVAEVEAIDHRVRCIESGHATGIVVVAESQQRFGAACSDPAQLLLFLLRRDLLVRILDRPVVIGAESGVVVVALRLALEGHVVGVVVHHRTRDALRSGEFAVAELGLGHGGRCLEVVRQAQGMTHLVHHGVLDHALDEGLGLRAHRERCRLAPRAGPARSPSAPRPPLHSRTGPAAARAIRQPYGLAARRLSPSPARSRSVASCVRTRRDIAMSASRISPVRGSE